MGMARFFDPKRLEKWMMGGGTLPVGMEMDYYGESKKSMKRIKADFSWGITKERKSCKNFRLFMETFGPIIQSPEPRQR